MVSDSDIGAYKSIMVTSEEPERVPDEPLRKLFNNQYVQSGLVSQADIILIASYKYFLTGNILSKHKSDKKGKGKANYNACDASNHSGLSLAKECFNYQNYLTSFRLIQLLVAENYRLIASQRINITDILSHRAEALESLLQNVLPFHNFRCFVQNNLILNFLWA